MSDLRRQLIAVLPRLHRLAGVIVRNSQDGDDLFQKTVARMLEREAGWEPGSRLDLWAARIMKNIWLDELRMRARWARLVEPIPEADLLSDDGDVAVGLEQAAGSAILSRRCQKSSASPSSWSSSTSFPMQKRRKSLKSRKAN